MVTERYMHTFCLKADQEKQLETLTKAGVKIIDIFLAGLAGKLREVEPKSE